MDDESTLENAVRVPRLTATELAIDIFPIAMAAVMALFLALRVAD
jgi:hypothetical protein